ncbi:MAG TPA: hypothetical protein DHV52_00910, partial [Parachlamydiales bacterium]|nr:hypothetical protein [Parachlamydiales bacterium]
RGLGNFFCPKISCVAIFNSMINQDLLMNCTERDSRIGFGLKRKLSFWVHRGQYRNHEGIIYK